MKNIIHKIFQVVHSTVVGSFKKLPQSADTNLDTVLVGANADSNFRGKTMMNSTNYNSKLSRSLRGFIASITGGLLLIGTLGATPAIAQVLDPIIGSDLCMDDVYQAFGQGGTVGCTAGEVVVADTTVTITDGCAFPGDTATVDLKASLDRNGGGTTYDLGIFFGLKGSALFGTPGTGGACNIYTLPYGGDGFFDEDGLTNVANPFDSTPLGYCGTTGSTTPSEPIQACNENSDCPQSQTCNAYGEGIFDPNVQIQDTCGDIDGGTGNTIEIVDYDFGEITLECIDIDADGNLDLPTCIGWAQSASDLCLSPEAAVPGASPKCECNTVNIAVPVPGAIVVDKVTASAPAGDTTSFDFEINGTGEPFLIDNNGELVPAGGPVNFSLTDAAEPFVQAVSAATGFSVTEAPVVNWTTTVACTNDNGTSDDTSDDFAVLPSGFAVNPGQTVTCIFTNTFDGVPSIDIIKDGIFTDDDDLPADGIDPTDNDGIAQPGELIDYTFTVTNDGDLTLTNVSVTDPLVSPIDCTPESNPIGDLTATEFVTCTGTYPITQADIDAGQRTNTATATGDCSADDLACATDSDGHAQPLLAPSILLVKTGTFNDENGDGFADKDETISYAFTVTNDGNVTLTNLTLADTIGGVTITGGPIASLAVDAVDSTTFTGSYTLTQADVDAGTFTNTATATGQCVGTTACPVSDPDSDTQSLPAAPSILLTKTASAIDLTVAGPTDRADAGDQITYSFTILNDGNVTLDTVNLDDALVGYADFACNDADGILVPGASTSCSATYTLTLDDVNAGSVSNTATAQGTDPSDTVVDDTKGTTTTIPAAPSILLTKTASAIDLTVAGPTDRADAGDQITYSFTILNDGNVTLDTVNLDDALVGYADFACNDADGILVPGASTSCSATYTLTLDDVNAGSVSNTATAQGTDPSDTVVDDTKGTTTTIPREPAHSFVKTFDPNPVGVGETGTFTLVYTNIGNVTLNSIDITDTVDPFLRVDLVTPTGAICTDDDSDVQTITCSVASLAPGGSVMITVNYTAMPLDLAPDTGQLSGANYVFYFENGYVLYGSTGNGTAFLIDPDGSETPAIVEGRNQDIFFYVPVEDVPTAGADGGFQLHLSCSEILMDGYSDLGPTFEDDEFWEVLAYDVQRFNSGGLFKDCRQIFDPIYVDNFAQALATPAGGTLDPNPIPASDTVELINVAPIEVTRERVRKGDVEIQYFNISFEELQIDIIRIQWDNADGVLLESASYQDGVDLDLSGCVVSQVNGKCSLSAAIDTILPPRSKDWLKLSFIKPNGKSAGLPNGLTVTIVTSDGSTLYYEWGDAGHK